MQLINSAEEMQSLAFSWHKQNQKISFVPTMGALHEGHLSLLREGRKTGDKLVLSIYVNPAQFAPTEDLAKYPRDTKGDLAKASDCRVDAVFFPSNEVMYPKGCQTYVEVANVTKGLCGASRPSHFRGVATVVLKLFNIVQPHVAIFGEKDYQQLITIQTMARDLNLPVEIKGMPTVREPDGLALSSRNAYLSKEERIAALSLSQSLKIAKEMAAAEKKDINEILESVKKAIEANGLTKTDYIKICDSETLEELTTLKSPARLLIAAFVGKTRLIDNCGI
ncbi:MAG: pantoate--beta-alanine ligase [Deltaproteobacteria bacterium]|nr:pantoate--beta-alanine ligase [Deltaproteobacteria bacterium]